MRLFVFFLFALVVLCAGQSAGVDRNAIRPIPPVGIVISATDRAELESHLQRLMRATSTLENHVLIADVLIYQEAVRYALQYNEFFKGDEILKAHRLLDHGLERASALAEGRAPWTTATGLVVRGYRSKIDNSIQPYGLVVPESFHPKLPNRWRLDGWFHGRGETLSEVNFLAERESRVGEFASANTIVLHLYGRYCNASRFAGEVDFEEALASVQARYAIDENRILIRGFSMGGASAWDFGTHHAGRWAAVAPGAGFSETVEFLRLKLDGADAPPAWEQKLWRMYDATEYALNLANTSTVAYNGDEDGQKQAADAMERALAREGIRLTRVTGLKTGHRYSAEAKVEINEKLDAIAAVGREPYPRRVQFTTFTLAYNRMKWVVIDGLAQHWERARIDASIAADDRVEITTSNTTGLTLDFGPGGAPFGVTVKPTILIDGQKLTAAAAASDRSWRVHLRKVQTQWSVVESPVVVGLHKVHGLQGPVDHAFMDRFVIVKPSGQPSQPATAKWVESEAARAIEAWRKQFRGEPVVKEDSQVSEADIAGSNLILWGDPGSNQILARIAKRLPIQWSVEGIRIGNKTYPKSHVPILIYPNPLNPAKYVVINSGFSYREFDYLNNARQTPKIPDWAIVDTSTPAGPRYPGKIAAAGFFNEEWALGIY